MRAALPRDENERLSALRSYGILETPQESEFDEIVQLAAQICDAPVGLITLLEEDRQWFKAKVGTELPQTPRDESFCAHGILSEDELLIVPDATRDERFADNPLVTGDLHVRFYAGAAIRSPQGHALGSLCVLDTKPRELTEVQANTLKTLARQVMAQIELRKNAREIENERQRFRNLLDDIPAHIVVMEGDKLRYDFGNRAFREFIGNDDFIGRNAGEAWNVPNDHLDLLRKVMTTGEPFNGVEAPVPLPTEAGKTGYFDFAFYPLRDGQGDRPGVFVYSADVTEKVVTRRALTEERAHLDKTLATAEIATFDYDPDTDRVRANPLLNRFFGIDPREPIDGSIAPYLAAIHEEDRERVSDAIGRSLETGSKYEAEYRTRDGEGVERWVLARGETSQEEGKRHISGVVLDITGRKSAEAERERLLHRVEVERQRLVQAFDETPIFICLLRGMDLVFEYANEPYYQLIGHREVLGKPLREALPEIPAQGFVEILQNVLRTGETWEAIEVPVQIQRTPGAPLEMRILNLRYVPEREPDGTVIGVYSHAMDVTDQVVARRKLAESEERFRLGQKAGRVGTFEWLIPQDRIIWSPELELLYGVPEGTFEGQFSDWQKRVVPEDGDRVVEGIGQAIANAGREYSYEFRAVLPNGEFRWLAGQAQFDYDIDGKPLRMAGVNVDIHDRKRAESELRASEQRFRIVAQATRDAVWDWDLRDDSVWWNEGITDLFGYSREAVTPTAQWWVEHIHPEDRERVVESIHDAIDSGESHWEDEYRYLTADGGFLIVEDRGYAVFGEDGRPMRMVGAMTDVTKERREAQRLEFLREFTESLVEVRDARKIIEIGSRRLAEHLQASRSAYAEVAPDQATFTMWDWSRDLPSVEGTYPLLAFGPGNIALLQNGQTVAEGNVFANLTPEEGRDAFLSIGIQAIVVCPLVKQGRLTAMFAVHQSSPREWSEEEIRLVQQVADRLWSEIERARAETALRQNAEQLQTIFDNAEDDAIILMDPERRIQAWNRAAEKICGWTAAEAYGRKSDLLFTREERAAGEPQRKADVAAREGKILSERWYQRRDGSRFWGSGTMTALRNPDGSVRGYLKMFRDATIKQRELVTLAFLQRLMDTVHEIREPADVIETTLRMLGEHLGVDRCAYAEIEEDEETAYIHGNWRPRLMSIVGPHTVSSWGGPVAEDLRAGRTFIADDIDLRLQPEDGGELLKGIGIYAVICAPLMKEGRLAGAVAIHQAHPREWNDEEIELVEMVTDRLWSEIERARAEKSLRKLNEDLEERVVDRTARLESAIRESEAFNYSISHDLRAPLRSIVATSRILLEDTEGQLDEESRKLLERQAHNASRLGVLIDELLRLSRLGRVEVHRADIDMSELVTEFVGEMERANMTHGCAIHVEPGIRARGDARLVRLVYANLLENACKFSPEGGNVWVGHRRNGEDDVFFVRDEGVGFDMAYAHKLFLPFERLVTEAEFPGTGIGLANVERIIRRHGGQVWAESEPGKGASFFFTLS